MLAHWNMDSDDFQKRRHFRSPKHKTTVTYEFYLDYLMTKIQYKLLWHRVDQFKYMKISGSVPRKWPFNLRPSILQTFYFINLKVLYVGLKRIDLDLYH
jgi:hypothetical protein